MTSRVVLCIKHSKKVCSMYLKTPPCTEDAFINWSDLPPFAHKPSALQLKIPWYFWYFPMGKLSLPRAGFLWFSWTGSHPENNLPPKFGYILDMKVETKPKSFYILGHLFEFIIKIWQFGPLLLWKIFVLVEIIFFRLKLDENLPTKEIWPRASPHIWAYTKCVIGNQTNWGEAPGERPLPVLHTYVTKVASGICWLQKFERINHTCLQNHTNSAELFFFINNHVKESHKFCWTLFLYKQPRDRETEGKSESTLHIVKDVLKHHFIHLSRHPSVHPSGQPFISSWSVYSDQVEKEWNTDVGRWRKQ